MGSSPEYGTYRNAGRSTAAGFSQTQIAEENARFMARVYRWMSVGLAVTAAMALLVANSPALMGMLLGNPLIMIGLIVAELVMVWKFSSVARNASATKVAALFLTYSAVSGVVFSVLLLAYTAQSIGQVFIVTMVMFGAMSIYGTVTKKDLSSIGSFCFMGLIGLIGVSVVNFFVQSSMLHFAISVVGVLVFVGLTAYDSQKIKAMNIIGNEGTDEDTKEALRGALVLYLDFVNLFILLLRLLGDRRR